MGQLFQLAAFFAFSLIISLFTHCFLTYSYLHDCLKAAIIYMFYYYFFRLPPSLSSSFNPHDFSSPSFPSLPSPLPISLLSSLSVEGSIQLVGGCCGGEGVLQTWVSGEWLPVCAEGWGREESRVACRQLGFDRGAMFQGESSIRNLNCKKMRACLVCM